MSIANGVSLTWCRITIPWSGAPLVELNAPDEVLPVAGLVTTKIEDLIVSATLLPSRSGLFAGQWSGTGVCGRNGWGKYLPAKGYRSPFGLLNVQIIQDAAREAGELPPVVMIPDYWAGYYVRRGDLTASQVFSKLPPSQDWWLDPTTGITQVGIRPPSVVSGQFDIISHDPAIGKLVIATDTPSQFKPNATFIDPMSGVFQINAVVWTYTATQLRGEVWVR